MVAKKPLTYVQKNGYFLVNVFKFRRNLICNFCFRRPTKTEASTAQRTVIPHRAGNGGKEGEV
jgi:hypothetical protein